MDGSGDGRFVRQIERTFQKKERTGGDDGPGEDRAEIRNQVGDRAGNESRKNSAMRNKKLHATGHRDRTGDCRTEHGRRNDMQWILGRERDRAFRDEGKSKNKRRPSCFTFLGIETALEQNGREREPERRRHTRRR